MSACAAENAEDAPRASMTAAPRFCTSGTNSFSSHIRSTTSVAFLPPTRALTKSGKSVEEWLPQMTQRVTSFTGAAALSASCIRARFWSSRVIAVKRSEGTPLALDSAIRQLVLQGLPTTTTRTSREAFAAMALPSSTKIGPFSRIRSLRSMPGPRGFEPTSRTQSASR